MANKNFKHNKTDLLNPHEISAMEILKKKLSENDVWENQLSLNRWDFIKVENSINTNLYFIETGCVHVYFLEEDIEHSMYFGFEGSIISDLSSFLNEEPSILNIRCIKKTSAKIISKTKFNSFLADDPEASKLWREVLCELSLWHIERQKDLMYSSPKKRLQRALLRQPLLFQKVPHKYIASYLRMSAESLSRIYKS